MKPADIIHQQQREIAQLNEHVLSLQNQLEWFRRQVFGRKSERQIDDNPYQELIFGDKQPAKKEGAPGTDVSAHKRSSRKQGKDNDVNDHGLRFDDSVPQKIIDVPCPELEGEHADEYEVIGYKDTTRLAQQPGSHVVLI